MSQSETRNAIARENSARRSILLRAIERARAIFLQDRVWRTGWVSPQGNGSYTLTVRDTVYGAYPNAVQLVGTAQVKGVQRRVEMLADLPPTSMDLGILVMGTAN
jgi:hypothetical protein